MSMFEDEDAIDRWQSESPVDRGTVSAPAGTLDVAADTTEELDSLVQKASTPSLATLFQRGKQSGLIKAGSTYAGPKSA